MEQNREVPTEYLFELAPLGPSDLLSRCREGAAGNWWGEEGCLRVDEQGHVVLIDPLVYFEHYYSQRTFVRIAASACFSLLSGRVIGRPSPLSPTLVEHLCRAWNRPARPIAGVRAGRGNVGTGEDNDGSGTGFATVALERHVAVFPLRPWTEEATVMSPLQGDGASAGATTPDRELAPNLRGQALAWSDDGSVVAVSHSDGGVSCFFNPPSRRGRGVCLATVSPHAAGKSRSGVAGLALRGSFGDSMEVIVLSFDAVLNVYTFYAGEASLAETTEGEPQKASSICQQRLGRWHASTSAMSFHAATDIIAIVGPSGVPRPGAALALTLWLITGGACARPTASTTFAPTHSLRKQPIPVKMLGGPRARHVSSTAASRHDGGGEGDRGEVGERVSVPSLSVLHCIGLEGGSIVVPAPRDGLDWAPPGTVPALLPLLFPGLRLVSPPVQVVFSPSGHRLAVLDLSGGVSVVEVSDDTARTSPHGRRSLSVDGRSWLKGTGIGSKSSTLVSKEIGSEGGSGAETPRVVSLGWWSEQTLGALSSRGELAFLDTAAEWADSDGSTTLDAPETSAFQGGGRAPGDLTPHPRPPPLGPECAVWFAGDGKQGAVCWSGTGGGGGNWGDGALTRGGRAAGQGGRGSVVGLLSLATAVEAVDERVRRGLLGEALDLAVACGLDDGGVRAALWRKAVDGGSVTVNAVEEHLAAASDHRWVVQEALTAISLSDTEEAASALLAEGLRRCAILLGDDRSKADSGAAAIAEIEGNVPKHRSDGWNFSDDESDLGGDEENTSETGVVISPRGDRGESGLGNGDVFDTSEVRRLRARLRALQGLVETHLIAESVEGQCFDSTRLRNFLSLGNVAADEDGATALPAEAAHVPQHDGMAWEDGFCRRRLLQAAAMEFAVKAQASALGVLFERHPLETLPVRLETLSALPETLDPTSYAHLLPSCGPPKVRDFRATDGFVDGCDASQAPVFFRMCGIPAGPVEILGQSISGGGPTKILDASTAVPGWKAPRIISRKTPITTEVAAAAERQADVKFLAGWYTRRVREFDVRGGQLRYALSMSELAVPRVGVSVDDSEGYVFRQEERPEKGTDSEEGKPIMEVKELLALRQVLRNLSSLLYSGSVEPSLSLHQWESMNLHERMEAVLQNSSAASIAADVRAFYANAANAPPSVRATEMELAGESAAENVPREVEDTFVRVLGRVIRSMPSAETMEICAAVAKVSRPDVPEQERLINAPENLLTLLLDSCYAWTKRAPDLRALEAAWDILECIPSRRDDVDASLQDRADALEGHLYATEVLNGYGLAPPLQRYLEMGGGAEGFGRNVPNYTAFGRTLVDQMCAVVMERAGIIANGDTPGYGKLGMGRLFRKSGATGAGRPARGSRVVLDSSSREAITKLHKDVSRLQINVWKGLGESWAIRRVLQAVVEAGQFDVAKALVDNSTQHEEGMASGDEEEKKKRAQRNMAEDVLLSSAAVHFNAAPSFRGDSDELDSARRWLGLMPWTSPNLERERQLHEAGRLAYELGASDLVPLQLRLKLEGEANHVSSGVENGRSNESAFKTPTAGAIAVLREVLRCNPAAYAQGRARGEDAGLWTDGSGQVPSNDESRVREDSEGVFRTPPGTGLMRLADLLGLSSSGEDVDRVRAVVARAALDNCDLAAACDILSPAILRRPPRHAVMGVGQAEHDATMEFAPELCEVLYVLVRESAKEGRKGTSGGAARTAEICAQALSRCTPSQVGSLLDSWSMFEAAQFLSTTAIATRPPSGATYGDGDRDGDSASGALAAAGSSCIGNGDGGSQRGGLFVASLVAEGMEPSAAAAVEQALNSAGEADGDPHENGIQTVALPDMSIDKSARAATRAAEGALRLLLMKAYGTPISLPVSDRTENGQSMSQPVASIATAVGTVPAPNETSGADRDNLRAAVDLLCLHLAQVELRSAAPRLGCARIVGDDDGEEFLPDNTAVEGPIPGRSHIADTEFGLGPVERGVGYALVAADGRAVLKVLRALLEEAEGRIKDIREQRNKHDAQASGVAFGAPTDEEVVEPDESLVSTLHKRGISVNRSRRACVATTNSSLEAALVWCVEHASDPAMDAPLPPRYSRKASRRQTSSSRPPLPSERRGAGVIDDGECASRIEGTVDEEHRDEEYARQREECARAEQEITAAALEAYVRARLSEVREGIGNDDDGGKRAFLEHGIEASRASKSSDVASTTSEAEVKELVAVLSSFKKRASIGAAEDRIRALLSSGIDIAQFIDDGTYRQSELERAASQANSGGEALQIVALSREYVETNVWSVAAAFASAQLSTTYSRLKRKGLPSSSAVGRVEQELRGGDEGGVLKMLLDEGRAGMGLLELARAVFINDAAGTDLYHMDLLLRIMTEGAVATSKAKETSKGGHGNDEGVVGTKSVAEKRLNAHCGLVRRLLKAAPPGLDYKCLVGWDPLADPLADPNTVDNASKTSTRSSAGFAAARSRAMAELRSVVELEHTAALSKLAARIPGLTGSAVHLAAAQRVLCGETRDLSPEALGLLRGHRSGDGRTGLPTPSDTEVQEADAACASVYHLVAPLLRKMVSEDLVEAVNIVCSPVSAGYVDPGSFSCRRYSKATTAVPSPWGLPAALSQFSSTMQPLQLTVRCRRRILAEAAALLAGGKGTSALATAGDVNKTTSGTPLAAEELFARLSALLSALDAVSPFPSACMGLEWAYAHSKRPLSIGSMSSGGEDRDGFSGPVATHPDPATIASEALIDVVKRGGAPDAVEAGCSSMRAALGVSRQTEGNVTEEGGKGTVLYLSHVFATAVTEILERLTRESEEERVLALHQLHAMCAAVAASTTVAVHLWSPSAKPSSEISGRPPASKVRDMVMSKLEQFSREDTGLYPALDEDGRSASAAATAVVYRARAEVLTLVRTFGKTTSDESDEVGGGADVHSSGRNKGTSSGAPGIDVTFPDAVSDPSDGNDGGTGSGGGSDQIGRERGSGARSVDDGRKSPPPRLSVPFFRVAELAMEAFVVRVTPEDVESWEARSTLMETLTSRATVPPDVTDITSATLVDENNAQSPPLSSAPTSGGEQSRSVSQRLQALADILAIWECEAWQERTSPSPSHGAAVPHGELGTVTSSTTAGGKRDSTLVRRMRRFRVEAAVRAILEPAADGNTGEEDSEESARQRLVGDAGGQASMEFMRRWWPKLLKKAADAGEWEYLARSVVSGPCFAFTTESFEEALWATLEALKAPKLLPVKVGLASMYPSRHRAAANLVAAECCLYKGGIALDDEALNLILSSPALSQFAKTPVYTFLAKLILRCGSLPRASSSTGMMPTSSPEFLMLAMACAGAHARAAALACEISGIHPGLRSLDGGLTVLGRRLCPRIGGEVERGNVDSGVGALGEDYHVGEGPLDHDWFLAWLIKLRQRAWLLFEADVLE